VHLRFAASDVTISQKDPQRRPCPDCFQSCSLRHQSAHSDIKAAAVGEAAGNLSSRQCRFAGQKVRLELIACVFGFLGCPPEGGAGQWQHLCHIPLLQHAAGCRHRRAVHCRIIGARALQRQQRPRDAARVHDVHCAVGHGNVRAAGRCDFNCCGVTRCCAPRAQGPVVESSRGGRCTSLKAAADMLYLANRLHGMN